MYSVEKQCENVALVMEHFAAQHYGNAESRRNVFSTDGRVYFDSRPDYPFPERFGPAHEIIDRARKEEGGVGFAYETIVHSIYTCGPVVIISRTDTRKQEGRPDKPIPVVAVLAVKDGKITEWSDYYR
jgi:limonene-1,2-epoxide hydrolase